MKLLASVLEAAAVAGLILEAVPQLRLNAGIGPLAAAMYVGLFAYLDLGQDGDDPTRRALARKRKLLLGYELLILGTANALATPHVASTVAAAGAAVLGCGQTLIFVVAWRNPRTLRPTQGVPSTKQLGVRSILFSFLYVGLAVVITTIYVSHPAGNRLIEVPLELQWPGIALLYATFGCLAVGIASDHSRGTTGLYVVCAVVVVLSIAAEFVARRNWYLLALTLVSFLVLVPGWPKVSERSTSTAPASE